MDKTLKRQIERKILFSLHDYIIGMIPEKVRKIVGWILLIFGAVAILLVMYADFSEFTGLVGLIALFVGIFSIG
ncbi:MAG: hypothetical protein VYB17_03385, partial [Candidatus Thermoplasmatota archaeon]|nr:hypothetical protein [Candidatus Thermoplasmatota archaeon]